MMMMMMRSATDDGVVRDVTTVVAEGAEADGPSAQRSGVVEAPIFFDVVVVRMEVGLPSMMGTVVAVVVTVIAATDTHDEVVIIFFVGVFVGVVGLVVGVDVVVVVPAAVETGEGAFVEDEVVVRGRGDGEGRDEGLLDTDNQRAPRGRRRRRDAPRRYVIVLLVVHLNLRLGR